MVKGKCLSFSNLLCEITHTHRHSDGDTGRRGGTQPRDTKDGECFAAAVIMHVHEHSITFLDGMVTLELDNHHL